MRCINKFDLMFIIVTHTFQMTPSVQHLRELSMEESTMHAKILMSSAQVSVIISNYCVFVITFFLKLY